MFVDLGMTSTTVDLSLFAKKGAKGIVGVVGSYVDDKIATGTKPFEEETTETGRRFKSSVRAYDDI